MNPPLPPTAEPGQAGFGLRIGVCLKLLFFSCLLISISNANDTGTSGRFVRMYTENGAPDNTVNDILQDRNGFLWFASRSGVSRYDGYKYTHYKQNPEDPNAISGRPYTLMEDKEGRIWIGTHRGGISRLDPRTDHITVYKKDRNNPRSLGSNNVYDLLQDSKGRIWAATYGGGLNRYTPETDDFDIFLPATHPGEGADTGTVSSKGIRCLVEGPDGAIWIGTFRSGLDRLDPETGIFTHYQRTDNKGLSHNTILSLEVTPDGVLWVGTQFGLCRYQADTDRFTPFHNDPDDKTTLSHSEIRALWGARDGALWVGTPAGLNVLEPGAGAFQRFTSSPTNPNTLSTNRIATLFEDSGGVMWIGGHGRNGLNKYVRGANQWKHYPVAGDPTESRTVKALFRDEDSTLWVGLFDGGLVGFRADQSVVRFKYDPDNPTSLSQNTVNAIETDGQGGLWLGTSESLEHFDPTTQQFSHLRYDPENPNSPMSNEIRVLLRDQAGDLWIGGDAGLDRYNAQTRTFQHFPPQPGQDGALGYGDISALAMDATARIWVGTQGGGLYIYDRVDGRFRGMTHDPSQVNSLPNNHINSLHLMPDGTMWVGTDRGLAQYRETTEDFERLSAEDGLEGLKILSLLHDKQGNLWFSTDRGISRFNLTTRHCDNYRFSGLQNYNEFNQGAGLRNPEGRLYFGGINGYHSFDPDSAEKNRAPNIVITDFLLLNKSVPVGTKEAPTPLKRPIYETFNLELGPKHPVFAFSFSALDYADPQSNSFAYRLKGFNEDWIYTDAQNRFATYTKLSPGAYVFQVKGANREGNWNHAGVSLYIQIKPPLWRTPLFYALYILVFLGIMRALFSAQRNHLRRKKEEELRELELKRQKDEAVREMELKRKTEELEFARQVQLSMLPGHDVNGDHVEVVGRMITASEVGGDYFDFLNLPEGRGCIACGDATGHGMTAGLIVGMTKACLLTLIENTDWGPAELTRQLNTSLKKAITQRSIGMGLALSMWDPNTYELIMSSAGMPFPLYYNHSLKELDPVKLKCPPLGFLRELPVQETRLTLSSGDVMIWLSDGFGERTNNDGAYWSQTSLRQEITAICHTQNTALAIADAILEACDQFAGGCDPEDDMTVVVMRVK